MAIDRFVEHPLHVEKGLGLGLEPTREPGLTKAMKKGLLEFAKSTNIGLLRTGKVLFGQMKRQLY